MRFSTTFALALSAVGLVAAQEKCQAQNIVDACVAGYKSRVDECNKKPNDFICLCDVNRDILVCYNNCPNSLDKPPVENTVTSYCNAAEPLRAAASASVASVASVAATQSKAPGASSTGTATGSATGSKASGAAPTASSFVNAGNSAYGAPAGVAAVAFLGAFGLL